MRVKIYSVCDYNSKQLMNSYPALANYKPRVSTDGATTISITSLASVFSLIRELMCEIIINEDSTILIHDGYLN